MTIISILKQRNLNEQDLLAIFNQLKTDAKKKLNSYNILTDEAKKEAENNQISISDYQLILIKIVRMDSNLLHEKIALCKELVQDFSRINQTIDDLRKNKTVGQLANRYGKFNSSSWLMLMNPGGTTIEYDENGKENLVKYSSSFVHSLFEKNRPKELIISYFKDLFRWTSRNRELLENYLSLTDSQGKSIDKILREYSKSSKYKNIYNEVYKIFWDNEYELDQLNQVETHTASIHSSVDSSIIKLAVKFDSKLADYIDDKLSINRKKINHKEINKELSQARANLYNFLTSETQLKKLIPTESKPTSEYEIKKLKYQLTKALNFVDNIISGNIFGNSQIVDPSEVLYLGLNLKEILAICFQSFKDRQNWNNPQEFYSQLRNFYESLYKAQRGYNIDEFGLEEDFLNHQDDPDDVKCISGCINQLIFGLRDHKDVEFKIIDSFTIIPKLSQLLPKLIVKLYSEDQESSIMKFLVLKNSSKEFLELIKNELLMNKAFVDEFGVDLINNSLDRVISKIDKKFLIDKIKENDPKLYKEISSDANHQILKYDFIFDGGNEEESREGRGYILYVEYLFEKEPSKAIRLIDSEINLALNIDNLDGCDERKARQFIEILLNTEASKLKEIIESKIIDKISKQSQEILSNLMLRFSEFGEYNLLSLLVLNFKLDINFRDSAGYSALHFASEDGYSDIMNFLLNQSDLKKDQKDSYQETALHLAVRWQHIDAIKILLSNKFDLNAKNYKGESPLHLSVGINNGNVEIFKMLIEAGADLKSIDDQGNNVLHLAVRRNYIGLISEILDNNFDINSKNSDGMTALHIAVKEGKAGAVKILIQRGCDVNALNKQNKKPFDVEINNKNEDMIKIYNTYLKPNRAIFEAIDNGDIDQLEMAISFGADVNCREGKFFNTDTALMYAISKNNIEMVKLLLHKGADVKQVNSLNEDAFDLASLNPLIKELLENHQKIQNKIEELLNKKVKNIKKLTTTKLNKIHNQFIDEMKKLFPTYEFNEDQIRDKLVKAFNKNNQISATSFIKKSIVKIFTFCDSKDTEKESHIDKICKNKLKTKISQR